MQFLAGKSFLSNNIFWGEGVGEHLRQYWDKLKLATFFVN